MTLREAIHSWLSQYRHQRCGFEGKWLQGPKELHLRSNFRHLKRITSISKDIPREWPTHLIEFVPLSCMVCWTAASTSWAVLEQLSGPQAMGHEHQLLRMFAAETTVHSDVTWDSREKIFIKFFRDKFSVSEKWLTMWEVISMRRITQVLQSTYILCRSVPWWATMTAYEAGTQWVFFFLWWFSEKLTYIFVRIKTDKPKLYISSISSTCCGLEIGVSVTIGYMGTKNIYNISHIARTSITMSIPPQDQFSVLLAGQYAADAKKVKVSNCPKSLADTGVGSPARRSRGNGIASTVLVPNSRVAIQTSGWTILSNEEVKG